MRYFKLLLSISVVIFLMGCSDDEGTTEPDPITYEISISSSANSIDEDGGSLTLTIMLDQVNQEDGAIPFELNLSGASTPNQDYSLSGVTSIASASQSSTITVTAIDDLDVEGDETIMVMLVENQPNVTMGMASVSITIIDDDMEPDPMPNPCEGTTDTYSIVLDPAGCTVDIEAQLGVTAVFEEEVSGNSRVINTNSIPNHNVGQFPNMGNPNTITAQDIMYSVPASPSLSSSITLLTGNNGQPLYRFGILFNGILLAPIAAEFFVNTSTGEDNTDWNENALSSEINLGTDCNNSHVFPNGLYHHHATPSAYIASLNIDGSTPTQIGWAADGFPVYYKYGNKDGAVVELASGYQLKTEERGGDGVSAPDGCPNGTYTQDYEYASGLGDLDECNGYQDPTLGYIYVITDTYPSIPRCFMGTPSNDFTNNP